MKFTLQRKRIDTFPEQKLFAEMERIWRRLGHRPSRTEWEASDASIHYNTYRLRFDGWVNACRKFIEYQMGSSLSAEEVAEGPALPAKIPQEAKRQIPLGLRLKVLDRDGYTCVMCGKTPALQRGVALHVDHRIPFASCFVAAFIRGRLVARCASVVLILPTVFVVADFMRRAPHSFS